MSGAPVPLEPEELELLRTIASGHSVFKPGAGGPDTSWLRLVNRLRILRDNGLIRLRESIAATGENAGIPMVIGPVDLTPPGRVAVEQRSR